jgi:hypothetical protein
MSELNALRAELDGLKANREILISIKGVINGTVPVGSKPEVVARAVRSMTPIPLKYTQSSLGLKALYAWSIENGDTQILQWTTRQISHALGSAALSRFRTELQSSGKSSELGTTTRQAFLASYPAMAPSHLNLLIERVPANSFWGRQLNRIGKANQLKCELWPSVPYHQLTEMVPMYDTLKLAIRNDHERPGRTKPVKELVSQSGVSPFVVLPALVEVFSPLMYWQAIYEHESLRKSALFKKLVVPVELVVLMLVESGAPQTVLQEIQQKYG